MLIWDAKGTNISKRYPSLNRFQFFFKLNFLIVFPINVTKVQFGFSKLSGFDVSLFFFIVAYSDGKNFNYLEKERNRVKFAHRGQVFSVYIVVFAI